MTNPLRRVLLLWPAAAGLAAAAPARAETARGSGRVVEQSRALPAFEAVAVEASFDVEVAVGPQAARVVVDDNLQALLEAVVENDGGRATLHLRWKRGTTVSTAAMPRVHLTLPRLTALALAGAGRVRSQPLSAAALQVSVAGAGKVVFDTLTADDLAVTVAGSGDVTASGRASRLTVAISGSGDVRLGSLAAADVAVRISGSGDATVHADRTLAVSIAGSGSVVHGGSAQPTTSVAGSGSVRRRG